MTDEIRTCKDCRWFVPHPTSKTQIGVCTYFTTSGSINAIFSKLANPHVWWTFQNSKPVSSCPFEGRQQ